MSDEIFERRVTTPAEREARKAFKEVEAARAMTDHEIARRPSTIKGADQRAAGARGRSAEGEGQMTGPRPAGRPSLGPYPQCRMLLWIAGITESKCHNWDTEINIGLSLVRDGTPPHKARLASPARRVFNGMELAMFPPWARKSSSR